MSTASVKCPQCGLTNFSTDEHCKRCNAELKQSPYKVPRAEQAPQPKLVACPDCDFYHSRQAASCPKCGRILETKKAAGGTMFAFSVVLGLAAALCLLGSLVAMYSADKIVGGDAFNFIIAAGRATAWACIGVLLAVVSAGFGISSTVASNG